MHVSTTQKKNDLKDNAAERASRLAACLEKVYPEKLGTVAADAETEQPEQLTQDVTA